MLDWATINGNGNGLSGVGALAAFAIAVITFFAQRKHNKLSVRPLPEIKFEDIEEGPVISLVNHGTGPMIIQCLVVARCNREVAKSLVSLMPRTSTSLRWFVGNVDGRSIPAGGCLKLLEYFNEEDPEHDVLLLRTALKDLSIHILYSDVYNGSHPACIRKLDWFGRRLI